MIVWELFTWMYTHAIIAGDHGPVPLSSCGVDDQPRLSNHGSENSDTLPNQTMES